MPIIQTQAPPIPPVLPGVQMVLITDFGEDTDDVFDTCLILQHFKAELFGLYGICNSTSFDKGAGAIDTFIQHIGVTCPVSSYKGTMPPGYAPANYYADFLYDGGYPRVVGLEATVDSSLTMLRELFAARTSKDMWLMDLGPGHVAAEFLASPGDGIDGRTGVQLIEDACAGYIWVAGQAFLPLTANQIGDLEVREDGVWDDAHYEYNINIAKQAAHDIFAGWPASTRLIHVPIHMGWQGNYGTTVHASLPANGCPVKDAWENWCTVTGHGNTEGRPAWSPPGIDFLLNPDDWGTVPVTLAVDAATGDFTLAAGGNHELLLPKRDVTSKIAEYDAVLITHNGD